MGVHITPKCSKYGVSSVGDISKSYFRNFLNLMDTYSSDSTLIFKVGF